MPKHRPRCCLSSPPREDQVEEQQRLDEGHAKAVDKRGERLGELRGRHRGEDQGVFGTVKNENYEQLQKRPEKSYHAIARDTGRSDKNPEKTSRKPKSMEGIVGLKNPEKARLVAQSGNF